MTSTSSAYPFYGELARILNSGQSRSVVLSGNVYDLFHLEDGRDVALLQLLCEKSRVDGLITLVYEVNGPIRLVDASQGDKLRDAWVAWKLGANHDTAVLKGLLDPKKGRERELLEEDYENNVRQSTGRPTVALEFLRQLTLCSRSLAPNGRPYLNADLLILVEGADILIPAGDGQIARMSPTDRHRIMVLHDWFSDPGFLSGADSVVLIAESPSLLHPRVVGLPQVLTVEVPAPDAGARLRYINGMQKRLGDAMPSLAAVGGAEKLSLLTAGLSLHAMRQLLLGASHSDDGLTAQAVTARVENFISTQLGEDVIEFKTPQHSLADVVGFAQLKEFLHQELIPRFRSRGADALPGAAIAGPIGGGKTFIFEAVANALEIPVLVLKNIRSQWFGQTDVLFERLRRTLEALDKVMIFVDEADTQFGGVGANVHATERRLTGKIQALMSDPRLRGQVVWLLMTARIEALSPDIRRPGRVGDLIIPVLDPEGDDRHAFLSWMLGAATDDVTTEHVTAVEKLTEGYSAAAFASTRSRLAAERDKVGALSAEAVKHVIHDQLQPDIALARRYQTLQALLNCTRRSLLPDPTISDDDREQWRREIRELELSGLP
ncbi:MAG: ATP-binding protein [Planctomycetota bacterium]